MFRQIKNSKSKGSMDGGEFIFCVGNAHLGQGVCFPFLLFLLLLSTCFCFIMKIAATTTMYCFPCYYFCC